jgi:hypothetical protein
MPSVRCQARNRATAELDPGPPKTCNWLPRRDGKISQFRLPLLRQVLQPTQTPSPDHLECWWRLTAAANGCRLLKNSLD